MEIQITILKILETQKFVSKKDGSEIVKNVFIGTTQGQYPKKIAFTVMGDDKFNGMGIVVDGTYAVSFDVESREWNGKWFTEASAWKAVRIDGAQGHQQAPQSNTSQAQAHESPVQENTSVAQVGGEQNDNLPF